MPPKKALPSVTILKFKRLQSTYVIAATSLSLSTLKDQLVHAINSTGGISLESPEVVNLDDEDNIPVPKSEYLEGDDMDMEDTKPNEASQDVTPDEISIAVPKDKKSPYDNQWIAVDESSFSDLKFLDFDILAFAYNQESFQIIEATYEDE